MTKFKCELVEAFAHACEALDLQVESLRKLSLPWPEPMHRIVMQ
ncbi:MAG: hypothetical protein WCB27_26160 [Thermoguttaceae bacterium]|jgi:hypothetical protein